jgi:hypothetical protein
MAAQSLSWSTVPLSDTSAVTFVGDWSGNATSSFHNASLPETTASVLYTFHGEFFFPQRRTPVWLNPLVCCSGTQARAVGFMTFNLDPLVGLITRGLGTPFLPIRDPPFYCTDVVCPSAFYTTPILPCNQYTLNLSVLPDQAMQLKEFGFVPCTSDDYDGQTSSELGTVSTTALASASASTHSSVIAAEKKPQLGTGMIVGAVIGALVAFALTSLALFIFLRRGRRISRPSSAPSASKSTSSPLPFFFSRSRPWLRLAGPQHKPSITSSAQFLVDPSASSSLAAASRVSTGGRTVHGRPPTPFDAPAGTSSSSVAAAAAAAQASVPATTTGLATPILPWLFDGSAEHYPNPGGGQQHANRDGEWSEIVEKQPLGPNDVEADTGGIAVAHGYLPDSKELMAWSEREQGVDPRTPRATDSETLPRYQTRGSLQWPS